MGVGMILSSSLTLQTSTKHVHVDVGRGDRVHKSLCSACSGACMSGAAQCMRLVTAVTTPSLTASCVTITGGVPGNSGSLSRAEDGESGTGRGSAQGRAGRKSLGHGKVPRGEATQVGERKAAEWNAMDVTWGLFGCVGNGDTDFGFEGTNEPSMARGLAAARTKVGKSLRHWHTHVRGGAQGGGCGGRVGKQAGGGRCARCQ